MKLSCESSMRHKKPELTACCSKTAELCRWTKYIFVSGFNFCFPYRNDERNHFYRIVATRTTVHFLFKLCWLTTSSFLCLPIRRMEIRQMVFAPIKPFENVLKICPADFCYLKRVSPESPLGYRAVLREGHAKQHSNAEFTFIWQRTWRVYQ